ncbi:CbtA family protein [Pelagibius sp. CAU 1746]|uniref:CbtA family protein n=1 Tax=Pelagibius sp. CAU 1746 TaxID=3140370 RepID=UPI00325AF0A8
MLHRILWAALVAGFVAGIASAVLQHFTTTPLILQAEHYENGGAPAVAHSGLDGGGFGDARLILVHAGEDHGEGSVWAPADGLERTLYTSVVTVGTAFGFALILLSAMVLADARISARSGLMWGAAGFAAAGLAPALGLSPELPGSAAAVLEDRQIWWIATAVATAAGLWLALRVSKPWAIAGGIVLMVLPHVIGAPHPDGFISEVPAELSGHFAAASLVVMAVIWSLAGTVAGYVWQRGEAKQAAAAAA